MDVYALYCDKGMAYDFVTSEVLKMTNWGRSQARGILYLGDSENDNPAFRKNLRVYGSNFRPEAYPKVELPIFYRI